MTKTGKQGRKTKKIVRTPATRFGHLQKRLKKNSKTTTVKTKK